MIAGAEIFLDTDILLYASNGRLDHERKWEVAHNLLAGPFGTSAQVLGEFYVNATQNGSVPLTSDEALRWVHLLARKPFQPIDSFVVRDAIELSQRNNISYWDAAILAAAMRLGAKIVYSEELNHRQTFGAIKIINPFLES